VVVHQSPHETRCVHFIFIYITFLMFCTGFDVDPPIVEMAFNLAFANTDRLWPNFGSYAHNDHKKWYIDHLCFWMFFM